jgi:hypothetical protein
MRSVKHGVLAGIACLMVFAVTPGWAQDAAKPPVMSHDAAGRDNCMMCHSGAMAAVPGVPESHEGRPNEACAMCHAADAEIQTKVATPVSHALEGRDNCMMCHTAGAMEPVPDVPASHEGRDNAWCAWCHVKAEG